VAARQLLNPLAMHADNLLVLALKPQNVHAVLPLSQSAELLRAGSAKPCGIGRTPSVGIPASRAEGETPPVDLTAWALSKEFAAKTVGIANSLSTASSQRLGRKHRQKI
jgi:hypothetical protein